MNDETRAKATPEQQAKLIVENLRARQDGWQWAEHVIARALRQSENDKLEEVGVLLDRLESHFDDHPASEATVISGAVAELSVRVRNLKSKD